MIGGQSKKKIAIISGAGIGIAGIAYVSLVSNPVAAAAIPAVLAFAACQQCVLQWEARCGSVASLRNGITR